MKKSIFLVLAAFQIILLSAFSAQAQHQRLGIAPHNISLNSKQPTSEVEAFCLDRNKVIDGTYDYNNVLSSSASTAIVTVGQRRLPLQKAINEGLIRVESTLSRAKFGSGIGVRFVSLTRLPVTIQIRDSLAVGENPGSYSNKSALEILRTAKANLVVDSKEIQQQVWEADSDRARLESLDYKSVAEFQQANGLPLNGLDAVTKAKLQESESQLIARFEAVGLANRRFQAREKSVSDNISLFQTKMGIKETSVYSPDVRAQFERYEKVDFPVIKELSEYGSNQYNYLFLRVKASADDSSLYTIYSPDRKLYEGNSVAEIDARISRLASTYGKAYVDLDFQSKNQIEAFKASLDISRIKSNVALVEGTPATKNVFFSNKRTFDIDNISQPNLEGDEYVSTIGLKSTDATEVNKNWKVKAASKVKETVIKFTDAFKNLIGRKQKQSLADILERARRVEEDRTQTLDVRVSFIDEFGEIRVVKILIGGSIQITAE